MLGPPTTARTPLTLCHLLLRRYSRRPGGGNGSNPDGPYKRVGSPRENRSSATNVAPMGPADSSQLVWRDPSFELLTSTGFPLFLRGNVGLAWYDARTTLRCQHELVVERKKAKNVDGGEVEVKPDVALRVQKCPKVLRNAVADLFPYRPLDELSELSVVTISLKTNRGRMRTDKEQETERMAQMFLIAAIDVCEKLRSAGYWADFVNPFSGRPYLVPGDGNRTLYEAPHNFRCLDFEIFQMDGGCKVVSNETAQGSGGLRATFNGSLFTNAPCKERLLDEVLSGTRTRRK